MKSDSNRLEELQKEIESHPGFKANVAWNDHHRIYEGVYRPNRRQLLELIEKPNFDDNLSVEMMQNVRPPIERERYINEFLRLLHNYLASEFSLVDHSRALISKYKGSNFETKYKEQLKIISEAPVHNVLQDLRAIFLHDSIPPIRWTVTLRGYNHNGFKLTLNIDRFLDLERPTAISKKYLKKYGKEVEIKALVDEHGKLVDLFNSWLHLQFQDLHKDDIESVNKLIAYRNSVLDGSIKESLD
jgi:hypothetical protein